MISDFLLTSCEIVFRASQFSLGSMFWMSSGLISASTCSSSASLGCRGKAAGLVLQVLRAQQRKLRVRSFILNVSFFLEQFWSESNSGLGSVVQVAVRGL